MKTPQIIAEWSLTLYSLMASGIIPAMECGGVRNSMFTGITDMVMILLQKIFLNESSTNHMQAQASHQPMPNDALRFSAVIRKMRVRLLYCFFDPIFFQGLIYLFQTISLIKEILATRDILGLSLPHIFVVVEKRSFDWVLEIKS